MRQKYRYIFLTVVAIVIIAVLLYPSLANFSPLDEELSAAVFAPTPEPYTAYNEALAAGRPIVLEFYARW
ncbi:MAG TPA: hypothetical protein VLH18_03820 [Candidatus Limnocylindrales bacterium]|nr:hypothetical protein [Candidatus Limnocylindrales bacterium]